MKPVTFLIVLLFVFETAFAQREKLDFVTDSITKEANALFKSESASWFGTDIFTEKCKHKMGRIGGYFSYQAGNDMKNIFFTNDDHARVLATITFPNGNTTMAAGLLDTTLRPFNKIESDYYQMRKTGLEIIKSNKDTLFKFYNNIGVNPVPLIINGNKKVYVLSGPQASNMVVFGNDYLITFDNNNKVTSSRTLHRNIITASYGKETDKNVVHAMHNHQPSSGDFMSATDICTLMLYSKFTTWRSYYVISANNVSIWDCTKNSLLILTREAWDRIAAHQAEKNKNER